MTEHLPREVIEELKAFPERMAAWRAADPAPPLTYRGEAMADSEVREIEERLAATMGQPAQVLYTQKTMEALIEQRLVVAVDRRASVRRPRVLKIPDLPAVRQRRAPWPAVMPGFPMAVRVPILLCAFVITVAVAMAALSWLAWRAFAARMNAAAARLP